MIHTDTLSSSQDDTLYAWARSLPKIDLHRHLEGSLRLTTIADLAQLQRIYFSSRDDLRRHVQVVPGDPLNFHGFLKKFELLRQLYTSKETVQRVTREAIVDAARDHVCYLELRFNPLALAYKGSFAFDDVVAWVVEATAEAQASTGTRTVLLLQIPRNEPLSVAHEIIEIAIATFGDYVRGIDLAGDEVHYPAERFHAAFRRAHDAGLHVTAHAGEAMGASSVKGALVYLRPHRVGHGIRAIESLDVIQMLREGGVTLEVCPTSNVHTGSVDSWDEHPLNALLDLGLRVTVNTDDPGISVTTLTEEYVAAVRDIGLFRHHIYHMLRHAAEAAFLLSEEKADLRERLRDCLSAYPGALDAFNAAGQAD